MEKTGPYQVIQFLDHDAFPQTRPDFDSAVELYHSIDKGEVVIVKDGRVLERKQNLQPAKRLTYFYHDPGHGWAKVKRSELRELGVLKSISHYSYQRGEYVFLEEDCDVMRYIEAVRARGIEPRFRHHYSDKSSRIRGYDCFRAD